MHPSHAPFLNAIKDQPDDDAPRLVFADWLDEHGEPERAELIRLGCGFKRPIRDRDRRTRASIRYERLLHATRPVRGWDFPSNGGWPGDGFEVGYVVLCFDRGIAFGFYGPASDWLTHADAILAEHPVREVRLTTIDVPISSTEPDPGGPVDVLPGRMCRFVVAGRDVYVPAGGGPLSLLIARWPGVAFHMLASPAEIIHPDPAAGGVWIADVTDDEIDATDAYGHPDRLRSAELVVRVWGDAENRPGETVGPVLGRERGGRLWRFPRVRIVAAERYLAAGQVGVEYTARSTGPFVQAARPNL